MQGSMETIRKALDKTREVMRDPQAVRDERKLPKAGTEPLDFETDEYKSHIGQAQARVKRDFEQAMRGKQSLPLNYNAEQIRKHFDRDYLRQVSRLSEIVFGFLPLANKLLMDKITGRSYEEVEIERATELRTILTGLGPTFIKVGQAVSIRPDILPRETMYELQKLCDDVPRFSNELARQIFKDELGKDFEEVFTDI